MKPNEKPNIETKPFSELEQTAARFMLLANTETLYVLQHILYYHNLKQLTPVNIAIELDIDVRHVKSYLLKLEVLGAITMKEVHEDTIVEVNPNKPDFTEKLLAVLWPIQGHEWKHVKKSVSSLYHIVQLYESA